MPQRVLFLLITCSVLLSASVSFAKQEFFPFVGEVSSKKVNVRAGQSENFERLYRLKQGDEVLVLGKGFSWYKIKLPSDVSVFISARFVNLLTENIGEVTGDRVNIRARATTGATPLGQLSKGDKFQVIGEINDWYEIKTVEDLSGWVSEEFITFKSSDVKAYKDDAFALKQKFALLDRKSDRASKKEEEPQTLVMEEGSIGQQALSQIYEVLNEENPPVVFESADTSKPSIQDKEVKSKEPQKPSGEVSVVGYIKPRTDNSTDDIKYSLVVDDKPVYLIKGWPQVIQQFLYYEVQIDGTIEPKGKKKYPYPVINISNIQLAL